VIFPESQNESTARQIRLTFVAFKSYRYYIHDRRSKTADKVQNRSGTGHCDDTEVALKFDVPAGGNVMSRLWNSNFNRNIHPRDTSCRWNCPAECDLSVAVLLRLHLRIYSSATALKRSEAGKLHNATEFCYTRQNLEGGKGE
jgi:hypothetical protein